jgi:hypothetical protein
MIWDKSREIAEETARLNSAAHRMKRRPKFHVTDSVARAPTIAKLSR